MFRKDNKKARPVLLVRYGLTTAVLAGTVLAASASAQAIPLAATSWQPQFPQVPAGSISSELNAVSCLSAKSCVALGSAEINPSTFKAHAAFWNGKGWNIRDVAVAKNTNLSAVSCVSARFCEAVGETAQKSTVVTIAERWNGLRWTVQPTPNRVGAVHSFLSGVSCTSTNACTAVGSFSGRHGVVRTLVERWNGAGWIVQDSRNVARTNVNLLGAVTCTSKVFCVATGASGRGPLAQIWDGRSWRVTTTHVPGAGHQGVLDAVSCTSANACVAVGGFTKGSLTLPLGERWSGHGWKLLRPAPPAGKKAAAFLGVSCSGSASCIAVGAAGPNLAHADILAEQWNGSSWAVQHIPALTGSRSSILTGLSCSSATACEAVGSFTRASGRKSMLAERFS